MTLERMSQSPLPSRGEPVSLRDESIFLKACRREPTDVTPIWLMRQAGRYMAEYRAIRAKVPFLELCKRPDLAAEVTVTAAEVLGVDAAILFADILLILEPLGFQLEFAKGEGPIIHNPVRAGADVDRVQAFGTVAPLEFVIDAIKSSSAKAAAACAHPVDPDLRERRSRWRVMRLKGVVRVITSKRRRLCTAIQGAGTRSWSGWFRRRRCT